MTCELDYGTGDGVGNRILLQNAPAISYFVRQSKSLGILGGYAAQSTIDQTFFQVIKTASLDMTLNVWNLLVSIH